jgi:AcrR family transcriptional regulator
MAAKGADAATINDITEAADVGFGSFYNHFASKEDILEAATNELFDVIGGKIDEAIYAIADPCVALAAAIRTFVGILTLKKDWARFIIRISSPPGYKRFRMYSRLFRDIQKIHASKRLEVSDPEVVTYAVGGAILFLVIALIERDLPEADAQADRGDGAAHARGKGRSHTDHRCTAIADPGSGPAGLVRTVEGRGFVIADQRRPSFARIRNPR